MSPLFEFIDEHDRNCDYRRTVQLGIDFECEHGHDVCPICDPCTCAILRARSELLVCEGPENWPSGSRPSDARATVVWRIRRH